MLAEMVMVTIVTITQHHLFRMQQQQLRHLHRLFVFDSLRRQTVTISCWQVLQPCGKQKQPFSSSLWMPCPGHHRRLDNSS